MLGLLRKFAPKLLIDWYHFLLAFLGAFFYGFPARKLIVIGVTGTNGKSTVVEMCHQVLAEAGFKVASQSTIQFKINSEIQPNLFKMTMPGRFFIQKFLRRAVNAGCKYAILEVTSEGILQYRHRFINFDTAVFTNLSPEHIERHGGFENYKKAKGELFKATKKLHIINSDDKNAEYFLSFPAKRKYGYTIVGDPISNYRDRISTVSTVSDKDIKLKLRLLGDFNVSNGLAAISVGLSQGISLDACKRAVEKIESIPGRMELVIKEPFKVFVDYAFTPNALEKVYQALQRTSDARWTSDVQHRLICVLGATGGGRDKWKRPVLGQIAAKYCDKIILTNEDPYDENPMEIVNEVAKGAGEKAKKVLDRREAIREAIKLAGPGDAIIVTGKGSEPLMCLAGGRKIPWDDREAVKEEAKFVDKIYPMG